MIRRLEEAADNVRGLIPGLLAEAGFDPAQEVGHVATLLGPLSLYRAVKPARIDSARS